MIKPNKGRITSLERIYVDDALSSKYPTNLGYLYRCTFLDHPVFGFSIGGHTSLVVAEDEDRVETLNSCYTKFVPNRDRDDA